MTKAQAKTRKAEWAKALAEGRVVRFNDGLTMKAYPTRFEAEQAQAFMRADGMKAEIVQVPESASEES